MSRPPLLPDRLRELWAGVDGGRTDRAAAFAEQQRLTAELRAEWHGALALGGETDLRASLIREVGDYERITDLAVVEREFDGALGALAEEWQAQVKELSRESVERYYESRPIIHELMDWHSVRDDDGPLAYVLALEVARRRGAQTCVDFGSGVGSGALLFREAGLDVTLADISTTLLDFCRWRFERRRRAARFVDLKRETLPANGFDMILAMDVFEHLVDPVATVGVLHAALRPGGVLYARINAEEDEDRPQHIARDFGSTFERMASLGLVEIWRDGWLWGHQVFEKRG